MDQQSDQNIDSKLQLKKALFKDVVSLYGPKDVGLDMPSSLSKSPHVLGSNHAILTLFSQAQTQNGEQKGLNYLNEHDFLRQLFLVHQIQRQNPTIGKTDVFCICKDNVDFIW